MFEIFSDISQEMVLYIIESISDIEYKYSADKEKFVISKIGTLSFYYNNLSLVVFNNNITDIDFGEFVYNKINKIYLSNTLNSIGDSAFMHNKLTKVIIPDSVESIGTGAFQGDSIVTQ